MNNCHTTDNRILCAPTKYKCPKCDYVFEFNPWVGTHCLQCFKEWIEKNVPEGMVTNEIN